MFNIFSLKVITYKNFISMLPYILIIDIAMIIYIGNIIFYLHKIKDCPCFIEKNKNNYTNINYLLNIEYIILLLSIFLLIILIFLIYTLYNLKTPYNSNKKIRSKNNLSPLRIFISILRIIIYILFIFYVYKFHENISEDCECSKSWIRYLLYIQTIFMTISIFFNIFMIL